MPLTHAQQTGLEAAILAYLAAAASGKFAHTVAAFKEETQVPGARGEGDSNLVVSGAVLDKAWAMFIQEHVQERGLGAAVLAYLAAAEGGRFARTVAAFKEEDQVTGGAGDGDGDGEAVLETAWVHVQCRLSDSTATAALYAAIDSGDLAVVQLYVCVGVDVEALRHGERERSPFLHAAAMNRLEIVQYFVGLGYDKEVGGRTGASTLCVAAQEGHIAVVRYLVEQGADKDKADNDGTTPLIIAAQEGHTAVVQYLVEQGADKDKADGDGETPLFTAAQEGHKAVVQYLVEHGADTDKARDSGATPLMSACLNGHAHVAEYLLDQGCDRDHADNNGWTALHCAALDDHIDVAHVLFRYGVKLDAWTIRGETPADVATRRGNHAFADAVRAEEIRRRDHGFKRDRSTIEGTEEHEAARRPRVEAVEEDDAVDESDDDDDDDDDDEES